MYVCTTYFQYVYTMYFRVVNVSMLAYACVVSIWVFLLLTNPKQPRTVVLRPLAIAGLSRLGRA